MGKIVSLIFLIRLMVNKHRKWLGFWDSGNFVVLCHEDIRLSTLEKFAKSVGRKLEVRLI